jgi:acylphosphatase
MKHYNITISGRVQGVFFRKYTVDEAQRLALKGFVKNLPNGNVYCEAEGEEAILLQFVDWCHKGSPLSHVTSVAVHEGALQQFESFSIAR